MQRFYKGRTNNHLTWVMVDATDFATPESALSAATKIKIYGKLRGQAAANFVSSGTGSLANDIQHVGASALGIYTIALTKPDLSDASAAWYDQYIISLSAAGAAYQTLIVDGGIDASAILAFSDAISNAYSAALQANSRVLLVLSNVSDVQSALTVVQSMASDAASAAQQGNSRVLLVQSRLSDFNSAFVSQLSDFRSDLASLLGTTGVALNASAMSDLRSAIAGITASVSASDISDIASAVWANTIGARVDSRVLLVQSRLSDLDSRLASELSDVLSGIVALSDATSNAYSAAVQGSSRALLIQSRLSDLDSRLVSDISDVRSMLTALSDAISDAHSDLGSKIGAIVASVSASDISDIASAVWAHTIGARVDSRVLVGQSYLSDIRSHVSDLQSDFQSRVPKLVATNSQLSDLASDIKSAVANVTATLSASDISDIASAVRASLGSDLSDILSAAQQANSRALVVQSLVSDVDSALTSRFSDLGSLLTTTGIALNASTMSDLRSYLSDIHSDLKSAIGNVSVALTASDISDIASAVAAAVTTVTASDISDIASRVDAVLASRLSDILSAAQQANSRVLVVQSLASDAHSAAAAGSSRALVNQSRISDVYSLVSDLQSDFQSRVPKAVANNSQLSALVSDVLSALAAGVPVSASDLSDIRSAITAGAITASHISDIASAVAVQLASDLSDILSAAQQGNSRLLVNQSRVSDVYSLLSDLHSDVAVISGVVSDIDSLLEAGVELGPSSLSDVRSAITANGVLKVGAEPAAVVGHTDTLAAKVDWLTALSRNKITQTATAQSLRNDADSADIASAAVSDDGVTFTRGEFGN